MSKWTKPPNECIKANLDVAVRRNTGSVLGVIYGDQSGEVLACASLFIPCCL